MLIDGDTIRLLDVKSLQVDKHYENGDIVEVKTAGMFPEAVLIPGEPSLEEDVYTIPRDSKYIEKV